jgi:hypothetical protein
MSKAIVLALGLLALGTAAGYHLKETEDHDELLICRMVFEQMNERSLPASE